MTNKSISMTRFITITISILLAFPLFAQNQKNDKNEQIISAKIAFFTTEIGITPEEAQVFWPIYNEYWEEIQNVHRKSKQTLCKIREYNSDKDISNSELKKLTEEYVESFTIEGKLQKKYFAEFCKIFSAEKVAKLYVAEESFRWKLTKMWREQHRKEFQKGEMTPPKDDEK
jgi:hypothetical protein